MIYFIKAGQYVKIGYTRDITKRMSSIQTGNPLVLELLALIKGNNKKEKQLHYDFSVYHKHGEWFEYTGTLVTFIENICHQDMLQYVLINGFEVNYVSPTKRDIERALIGMGYNIQLDRISNIIFVNDESLDTYRLNMIYANMAMNGLAKRNTIYSAIKTIAMENQYDNLISQKERIYEEEIKQENRIYEEGIKQDMIADKWLKHCFHIGTDTDNILCISSIIDTIKAVSLNVSPDAIKRVLDNYGLENKTHSIKRKDGAFSTKRGYRNIQLK